MKLAASNIGFALSEDVYAVLRHYGIANIEVAPGRIRDDEVPALPVVSMQGILWNTAFNIFDSPAQFIVHYRHVILKRCMELGCPRVVFGAPKARRRGARDSEELTEMAVGLFRCLGALSREAGVVLCIEPNSRGYGCDWLCTVAETLNFIHQVDDASVRLCLDTGNYAMEGDTYPLEELHVEDVGHVQVSFPNLRAVARYPSEVAIVRRVVEWVRDVGYAGAVSFEAVCGGGDDVEGFHVWRRGLKDFVGWCEGILDPLRSPDKVQGVNDHDRGC